MSEPHASSTLSSADKPPKAPKRSGSPAAEGSAPSAVLASTDGALAPDVNQPTGGEGAPPPDPRVDPGLSPEARADERAPDSEPLGRRPYLRAERDFPRPEDMEVPPFAVDALVRALEKKGYKLTKADPSPDAEIDDGIRGSVPDEDVPYYAAALTDKQLQDLLAIRARTVDVKKWKAMGAIPGLHWIPTQRARCTLRGEHGGELVPGVPVLMSDLDEATTRRFLADGTIHAPGQEPATPNKRA